MCRLMSSSNIAVRACLSFDDESISHVCCAWRHQLVVGKLTPMWHKSPIAEHAVIDSTFLFVDSRSHELKVSIK